MECLLKYLIQGKLEVRYLLGIKAILFAKKLLLFFFFFACLLSPQQCIRKLYEKEYLINMCKGICQLNKIYVLIWKAPNVKFLSAKLKLKALYIT